MRRAGYMLVVFAALALGGCGGAEPVRPDATVPDGGGDPPPAANAYPAAAGFTSPTTTTATLPLPYQDDLADSGADIQAPEACRLVDAPFGMASPGADAAVAIDGLVAGTEYVVKLSAAEDLAFYVATGCSTELGPSGGAEGECLLYV